MLALSIHLTVPLLGAPLAAQQEWIGELADLGYTDLWSTEADGYDAFTPLVLASQWAPGAAARDGHRPGLYPGPAVIAQSAAALAEVSGGRFVLCLGASSDVIMERWNGVAFDRPDQRVRDTVRFVKEALTGEKMTGPFETIETITAAGFRLRVPSPPRCRSWWPPSGPGCCASPVGRRTGPS